MNTRDPEFWQFWLNVYDFVVHTLVVILLIVAIAVIVKLHREIFGKK